MRVLLQGILTSWDCQRTIWDHVFDKMEVSVPCVVNHRSIHHPSGAGESARDVAAGDRAIFELAECCKYLRPDDL